MLGYLVVVITVAVLGVFGNILVLVTLFIDKNLHVLNNLFIANLAVADLFIAGVIHPFTAIGIIGGREYLFHQDNGQITYLCEFLASFCIISCSASVLSIGAVAVNRYVYICHNQVYSKIYTPRTIPLMVVGIWVIGALIDMPTYLGFGDHVFHERIYACFFNPLHLEYKLFFVIIGILSPVALTVYCYVRIVAIVFKSKRRLHKQMQISSVGSFSRSPTVTPADIRLLKTVAAMAILAMIIYTPFAITLLVDQGQVSSQVWMFSNGLMHSFSCMDWLIYAATNSRIRDGFTVVIKKCLCRCCIKETSSSTAEEVTSGRFTGTKSVVPGACELVSDVYVGPEKLDMAKVRSNKRRDNLKCSDRLSEQPIETIFEEYGGTQDKDQVLTSANNDGGTSEDIRESGEDDVISGVDNLGFSAEVPCESPASPSTTTP